MEENTFILNTIKVLEILFFLSYKCHKITWNEGSSVSGTQGQPTALAEWFTHLYQMFHPPLYPKSLANSKWKRLRNSLLTLGRSKSESSSLCSGWRFSFNQYQPGKNHKKAGSFLMSRLEGYIPWNKLNKQRQYRIWDWAWTEAPN